MRRSERRPQIDDSIILAVVLRKAKQLGWDNGVTLTRRDFDELGELYAQGEIQLVHTWHLNGSVSVAVVSRAEADRMAKEVIQRGGSADSYVDDSGSEEGN